MGYVASSIESMPRRIYDFFTFLHLQKVNNINQIQKVSRMDINEILKTHHHTSEI